MDLNARLKLPETLHSVEGSGREGLVCKVEPL